MQLKVALNVLRSHEAEFRAMGVRALFIFGSTARNQARSNSDVDLMVEFDGPATLDGYMTLKERLEELLQAPVDLVTTRGLKPRLKAVINREAVLVASHCLGHGYDKNSATCDGVRKLRELCEPMA